MEEEMGKLYIVNIHSMVDVITNSSTELYVIDKTKIEKHFIELFKYIIGLKEIDYETTIESLSNYRYKDDLVLPEECKKEDCYIIRVSNDNLLLDKIINKFFNPIEVKYEDSE